MRENVGQVDSIETENQKLEVYNSRVWVTFSSECVTFFEADRVNRVNRVDRVNELVSRPVTLISILNNEERERESDGKVGKCEEKAERGNVNQEEGQVTG